jgi:phenylacetate-CoA ligase
MNRNNIKFNIKPKSILCFSETLYDWQRQLLKETFHCPIFQQYSLRESVAFGLSCDRNNFHIFPEFGYVELIGRDGNPVTKENSIGEIVGTGFHNYIFPFIRYRTGDLGIFTMEKCSCGRGYPILKRIEGRVQELVVTKSKQLIPLTGVFGLVAMSSPHVKECQLYQDKEGELILRIVRTNNYSKTDEKTIQSQFKQRFGTDCELHMQYIDKIPRTHDGKYQFLIQKIPIEFSN